MNEQDCNVIKRALALLTSAHVSIDKVWERADVCRDLNLILNPPEQTSAYTQGVPKYKNYQIHPNTDVVMVADLKRFGIKI